jgi:hypothetical protein
VAETEPQPENSAAAIELAKCIADAAYFCHNFGIIDDTQNHGKGGGVMPFHLWPAQVRVMWLMMTQRLLIILKARQLGISWLCCSYALWLCLFQPGKMVLCFSQGQTEANELIRRILALYERLPEWMLAAVPKLVKETTEILEWDNGSRVRSLPATQKAGRSLTASLVILDEAAFLAWARQLYTALKPTVDGGGQLIVLSTANGLGNLFHQLWTRAIKKVNTFQTVFLPWWSRPQRTRVWYNAQLGEYTDPAMVKQEYPANANEAFVSTGRVRFQATWIEAQASNVEMPQISIEALPDVLKDMPGLLVYKMPETGRKYIIAADVAEGKVTDGAATGDYDAAVILDQETWEEVASLHGHWEPDVYAEFLIVLSGVYNDCGVLPERNNHGHAVLTAFKLLGFKRVLNGLDGHPGWHTNTKTKPQMIGTLAEALRDKLILVRTPAALDEMQIYAIKDDGSTGAPGGYFDDYVMAYAVALEGLRMPTESTAPAIPLTQLIVGVRRVRE